MQDGEGDAVYLANPRGFSLHLPLCSVTGHLAVHSNVARSIRSCVVCFPRHKVNQSMAFHTRRTDSLPSGGTLSRRTFSRHERPSMDSQSKGTGYPYIRSVNGLHYGQAPRATRSLSNAEIP